MLIWALVGCAGCPGGGSDKDTEPCVGDTGSELDVECQCELPTAQVGEGDYEFVSVPDGSEVTMIHGPQGGWHILGAIRVENILPIISIHYTITDDLSGVVVSDNKYRVMTVRDTDCGAFYPGMYGYLDVGELAEDECDTPPELLCGNTLTMQMDVIDGEDRIASDTLSVVAIHDPADVCGCGD